MPSWPNDLPFFSSRSGYKLSGPSGHIKRSEMSTGPDKRRLRTSAAARPFSGKISYLTIAQLAQFEAFYRDDLRMGVLSFDAVDPITGITHSYDFVSEYEITSNKLGVTVSATLEVLP